MAPAYRFNRTDMENTLVAIFKNEDLAVEMLVGLLSSLCTDKQLSALIDHLERREDGTTV
jgi:hypothetical protein